MRVTVNGAWRAGFEEDAALPVAAMEAARAEIAGWAGYAPTVLRGMPGLAAALGLGEVGVKEEAGRFGVGSFKALGPPLALARAVAREAGGRWRAVAATSGNHGRALAWGARRLGVGCTIFMPAHTSAGREAAIRGFGAEVVRVPGDFDASLAAASRAGEEAGTVLVADLPWRGSDAIPRDIVAGYSVLGAEIAVQAAPTHVFVAAGNGSLAAAVATSVRRRWGLARMVSVEPAASDAVRRSLEAGGIVVLGEGPGSVMDGLVVRAPSALAWPLLRAGIFAGVAVGDDVAVAVLRGAAHGAWGDAGLEIGETGIAAMAGLVAAAGDAQARAALGLDGDSRVVVVACEGVTDREVFARLLA